MMWAGLDWWKHSWDDVFWFLLFNAFNLMVSSLIALFKQFKVVCLVLLTDWLDEASFFSSSAAQMASWWHFMALAIDKLLSMPICDLAFPEVSCVVTSTSCNGSLRALCLEVTSKENHRQVSQSFFVAFFSLTFLGSSFSFGTTLLFAWIACPRVFRTPWHVTGGALWRNF